MKRETKDDVFNRSLRMAVEYGFKRAEKGQNLDSRPEYADLFNLEGFIAEQKERS